MDNPSFQLETTLGRAGWEHIPEERDEQGNVIQEEVIRIHDTYDFNKLIDKKVFEWLTRNNTPFHIDIPVRKGDDFTPPDVFPIIDQSEQPADTYYDTPAFDNFYVTHGLTDTGEIYWYLNPAQWSINGEVIKAGDSDEGDLLPGYLAALQYWKNQNGMVSTTFGTYEEATQAAIEGNWIKVPEPPRDIPPTPGIQSNLAGGGSNANLVTKPPVGAPWNQYNLPTTP